MEFSVKPGNIWLFVCRLTKLERLLKAGVSANAGDGTKANNRAIHWAATFGGQESVKLLCGKLKTCSLPPFLIIF